MTYDVSSTSSAADKDRSPRANRSPIDISKRSGVEKRFTEQSSRAQEPRHRAFSESRGELRSLRPRAGRTRSDPCHGHPATTTTTTAHGEGERREKGLRYLRSTGGRPARQASLAAALSRARRAGLWRHSIKVASPPRGLMAFLSGTLNGRRQPTKARGRPVPAVSPASGAARTPGTHAASETPADTANDAGTKSRDGPQSMAFWADESSPFEQRDALEYRRTEKTVFFPPDHATFRKEPQLASSGPSGVPKRTLTTLRRTRSLVPRKETLRDSDLGVSRALRRTHRSPIRLSVPSVREHTTRRGRTPRKRAL
ncbi:hypothetical protein IscW_ISCW023212 [Ixodes scapularis]|uniref:Uncharacterized protein n=1 Tax=Ixodes scapularis TaxID=6945 RepID=B7QJ95_IXOSC|nr:hypothetical protein IscW_ISCW023212 [Ixodes scapularis]|eukprot:XP_002415252.1 hypothetical protein IscW_ISCW023212 [Ixodes scapularis]